MRRFAVQAQVFCLCTGGLENPRLLLNFRNQMPQGIGNQNDVVGRFFCEHPHFVLGRPPAREAGRYAEGVLRPDRAFMNARQVLNFGLRLEPDQRLPPLSFVRGVPPECHLRLLLL